MDTRKRIRDKRKELTLFHHPVFFINYLQLSELPTEHFRNRLYKCPQKSGLQLRKGAEVKGTGHTTKCTGLPVTAGA